MCNLDGAWDRCMTHINGGLSSLRAKSHDAAVRRRSSRVSSPPIFVHIGLALFMLARTLSSERGVVKIHAHLHGASESTSGERESEHFLAEDAVAATAPAEKQTSDAVELPSAGVFEEAQFVEAEETEAIAKVEAKPDFDSGDEGSPSSPAMAASAAVQVTSDTSEGCSEDVTPAQNLETTEFVIDKNEMENKQQARAVKAVRPNSHAQLVPAAKSAQASGQAWSLSQAIDDGTALVTQDAAATPAASEQAPEDEWMKRKVEQAVKSDVEQGLAPKENASAQEREEWKQRPEKYKDHFSRLFKKFKRAIRVVRVGDACGFTDTLGSWWKTPALIVDFYPRSPCMDGIQKATCNSSSKWEGEKGGSNCWDAIQGWHIR